MDFRKVQQGQSLNFAKDFGNTRKLSKLTFNLNWGTVGGRSVDLDAMVHLEARDGREVQQVLVSKGTKASWIDKLFGKESTPDVYEPSTTNSRQSTVYFGNLNVQGVSHLGDDLTGANTEGEYIVVDLDNLAPDIDTLTFGIISYSGQRFSELPFVSVKVMEGAPATGLKRGLVDYEVTQFSSNTRCAVLAQLTKGSHGEWSMHTCMRESDTGSVASLIKDARMVHVK